MLTLKAFPLDSDVPEGREFQVSKIPLLEFTEADLNSIMTL